MKGVKTEWFGSTVLEWGGREFERVRCIVSRTISDISRCIVYIFAYDKEVPLFNALFWGQRSEYRHALYIVKNYSLLGYISVGDSMGLSSDSLAW